MPQATWTANTLTILNMMEQKLPVDTSDRAHTWKDYSLARMALIAAQTAGCGTVLPRPSDEALIAFRSALEERKEFDDLRFLDLQERSRRGEYTDGTLGDALRKYYEANGIGELDGTNVFPMRYIFLHDCHHALFGLGTDKQGEMNIIAFECAQVEGGRTASSVMPLMAQVLAFADWLKDEVGTIEDLRNGNVPPEQHPLRICAEYWQIGANVQGDILENWEIEADLPRLLSEVRQKYNIQLPYYA